MKYIASVAAAFLFIFVIPARLSGQVAFVPEGDPISPLTISPTAASLGKFYELPPAEHTGIFHASVPIWDIVIGDITFPINLQYATGGIKVDEIASWAGLGISDYRYQFRP